MGRLCKLPVVNQKSVKLRMPGPAMGKFAASLFLLSLGILPLVCARPASAATCDHLCRPCLSDYLGSHRQAGRRRHRPARLFLGAAARRGQEGAVRPGHRRCAPRPILRQEPHGDQQSRRRQDNPFYVTNGLLTVELVTGKLQVGDNQFITAAPQRSRWPRTPTIRPRQPTPLRQAHGQAPDKMGAARSADRQGRQRHQLQASRLPLRNIAYYEPTDRAQYSAGLLGLPEPAAPSTRMARLYYADLSCPGSMRPGFPISEPYWAKVKIAGQAGC